MGKAKFSKLEIVLSALFCAVVVVACVLIGVLATKRSEASSGEHCFFGGGWRGRSIFGDFGVFLGNRRRARMALEQKKPHWNPQKRRWKTQPRATLWDPMAAVSLEILKNIRKWVKRIKNRLFFSLCPRLCLLLWNLWPCSDQWAKVKPGDVLITEETPKLWVFFLKSHSDIRNWTPENDHLWVSLEEKKMYI